MLAYWVHWWLLPAIGLSVPALPEATREAQFMTFSVKQRNGVYVRDLELTEVSLHIGEEPVEVRFFGSDTVDVAMVLLLENSPRTAQFKKSLPQYGRINLIDVVRYQLLGGKLDELALHGSILLAEFYKELEVLNDFSRNGEDLVLAVQRMEPKVEFLDRENIPIGRMLGRAVDLLRTRPEKRKVIVLFTTTIDRESVKNLDEYRSMLRLSDIDLYVTSFAPRTATGPAYSVTERVSRSCLRSLVDETGGSLYVSGDYAYASEFIDDLVSRIVNTYTIGFYVTPGSEREAHDVEIQVDRPKCNIQHRKQLVF